MKAPKPQDNPKKKADIKPTSMTTNSGVAKANAEEKDRVIRYYENTNYLIKNKVGRTGYWNEFQKYLQDYTLPSGEKFIQNEQVNKGTSNEFSDKALQDYRSSLIKKYGEGHPNVERLTITPEDVKQVQTYYNQGDPNFKVDGRIGGETSQLRYPTLIKADVKVAEGTYAPVMYGKKQYLAPADKYNSGNFTNDLVPYNPSLDTKIDPNALKILGTYTTQSTNQEQPKAKGGIVQKLVGGGKVRGDKNGDGYVDAAEKQSLDNKAKYNEAIRALGQGVMVAGDAMNEKPTDIYADPKKDAAEKAVNNSVVAGASSINPWTALMVGASNIGKSGLEKDKYGDLKGGANQAAGEAMTAAPFAYSESAKKEGLGAVARDVFLGGQYIRAVSSGLGQGEKTSGFVGGINKFSGLTKRNEIRDKPFSQQKKEAAVLSNKTRQEQAVLNRNNNEENAKIIDPYAVSENPQYDKDKRLILNDGSIYQGKPMNKGGVVGKVKQMCSEGGEIEGEGGPKDDKIEAKVKEGSFVVPAENAELAKGIRKLYLKAPIKKANLKQEEGEEVKLSNGEHLFTPEENEYLESIGIDLEDLAPNAEEGNKKQDGGKVKPTKEEIDRNKKWVSDYSLSIMKSGMRDDMINNSKKGLNKYGIISKYEAHPASDDVKYSSDNVDKLINGLKAYDEKVKGYAEGGEIVDPTKELAKIEAERKAVEKQKGKVEADRIANEKKLALQNIIEKRLLDRQSNIKNWEKKYNDSKAKLDALNKSYEDMTKGFDAMGNATKKDRLLGVSGTKDAEYQRKSKEDLLKKIQEADKEFKTAKQTYDYVKDDNNYTPTGASKIEVAKKMNLKAPTIPKGVKKEDVVTKSEPVNKTTIPTPVSKQSSPKLKTEPFTVNANPDEEVIVPGDKLSPNERAIANADAEKATVQAAALNKSLPQNVVDNGTPVNRRRGIADVIANVDPTSFVGIGQAALGVNMLKDEKRPVDKAVIDPTYNAAVNRSIQDAKFGLTPEQKFMATQDIQNALNDAKAVGLNTSGGSGVQAFNTNRAAINDAWRNKLGLKQADLEARMNKQKYADAMAADRANILSANRRQAFNDAMATFQQKQQAGSELVGAGLQNIIGAYRFNKELERSKKIDEASNPYRNV